MPQFDSLSEAFEWFWENVYPHLPSEQKTNALRTAKYTYYKRDENVSEKRMRRILEAHTNYRIKHEIEIEGED